ncbi:MAG: DUF362 domain-containing protein [Pelotomaculum sp.]
MYVITDLCIKCRTCSSGCPANPNCTGHDCKNHCGIGYVCHMGAIVEEETQFVITEQCNDCGRCAYVCPMGAILWVSEHEDVSVDSELLSEGTGQEYRDPDAFEWPFDGRVLHDQPALFKTPFSGRRFHDQPALFY